MKFSENLYNLRKEKGLTANNLAKILGFMENTIYAWEKERAQPNIETLNKLADYFEVSVDYLLGRTDELGIIQKENSLSKNESELLFLFKKLDTVKQNKVIGYAYALAN